MYWTHILSLLFKSVLIWCKDFTDLKRSQSTQEVEISTSDKDASNEAFAQEDNLVTVPEVPETVQEQAKNESDETELGDILSAFPVRYLLDQFIFKGLHEY